jgi:HEAT repeats
MLSKLFRREPDDPELAAHRRAFADAAEPILADLRAAGVRPARKSSDLVDLAHAKLPSPEAADVLRSWLPRVQNMAVKGTVAQALTDKAAGAEAAEIALAEYRATAPADTESRMTKEQLAQLVTATAARSLGDPIADVVLDPAQGDSRSYLLELLVKWRHARAAEVALALLDDPDESMVGNAIWALGRLKAQDARARLEQLTDGQWAEPARLALEQLDRSG